MPENQSCFHLFLNETSEKYSALTEKTIGERLRGRGSSVFVCSIGTGETDPCSILFSLPTLPKFAMPWQFAETFQFFFFFCLKIFFLESQVILSSKS